MRLLKIKFFILTIFSLPTSVWADCNLSVSNASSSIVWDQNIPYQQVPFLVQKTGTSSCNIRIGFTKGGSGSYNRTVSFSGESVGYNLYKTTSLLVPLKDGTDVSSLDETINLSFGAGTQTRLVNYYITYNSTEITSPVYKRAGTYLDSIQMKFYDSTDFPNTLLTSSVSNIEIILPTILDARISNILGSFSSGFLSNGIELGELSSSKTGEKDLIIKTNVPYSVKVYSQNDGKLVHNSLTNNKISYSLSINNVQNTIGVTPNTIYTSSTLSSENGINHRISIQTTPSPTAAAGQYTDSIYFIVEEVEEF